VGIDGSNESWLALEHAVAASHVGGCCLTLLTVVPDSPALLGPSPVTREQLAAEVEHELQAVLARARDAVPDDVSVTTLMRAGDAAAAIVAVAAERGCDAIFLGSRGRGRIGSLLGSVSQAVMHRATANVLVVHAPHRR
jgi:nucleotide-binding universal stress UspA family protein